MFARIGLAVVVLLLPWGVFDYDKAQKVPTPWIEVAVVLPW